MSQPQGATERLPPARASAAAGGFALEEADRRNVVSRFHSSHVRLMAPNSVRAADCSSNSRVRMTWV